MITPTIAGTSSRPPMPIVVGAPRSGTTLLRFMLDAHPLLSIPPETGFLIPAAQLAADCRDDRDGLFHVVTTYPPEAPGWRDFGIDAESFRRELTRVEPFSIRDGVRAFYRLYARNQGKPRYGDKTPMYFEHIRAIGALLPEARFVHIVRDGRDVALSLRKTWFAPTQDIATLALVWRAGIARARDAGRASGRYFEVRYEDLVMAPRPCLEAVCRFVDLDFDAACLSYWQGTPERLKEHRTRLGVDGTVVVTHEQRLDQQRLTMEPPRLDRIFRWKEDMSSAERAVFEEAAGDMLREHGYELSRAR
jgi:hypothetical protein